MPQLDYLARQDHYLEPIFKGVCIRSTTEKTEDIQTRSAYNVNVDTHESEDLAIGKKPEKIRASTAFEPVTSANTGAMLYQLS